MADLATSCEGQFSTVKIFRYAKSHCLLGFQLRECRRLLAVYKRDAKVKTSSDLDALKKIKRSLQIGIDAARHEVAKGAAFVEKIEGKWPQDSR